MKWSVTGCLRRYQVRLLLNASSSLFNRTRHSSVDPIVSTAISVMRKRMTASSATLPVGRWLFLRSTGLVGAPHR